MSNKEIILGIDLGTTNSVVSIIENDKPIIIENENGKRTTPSVVAFKKDEFIVGEVAKRQVQNNPQAVASVKRFMGTKKSFLLGNKEYTPEEVSSKILAHIKSFVEKRLGQTIEKAVITVPAYFDNTQRQATHNAGTIAGLNVVRILNEPTAAALAYGFDKLDKPMKLLVFDLGGGTLDVSILDYNEKEKEFKVLAVSGDNQLGGDDWDNEIVNWLKKQIKENYNFDVEKESVNNRMLLPRLKEEAERVKILLSSQKVAPISLPFFGMSEQGPINVDLELKQSEFEKLTESLIRRLATPVRDALQDAKLDPLDLDEVLLVGGTTRIPSVQKEVELLLRKVPSRNVNPDEVVALGAAIQGGMLAGEVKQIKLIDVTPLTLGIRTGQLMTPIIKRNSSVPISASKVVSTSKDDQESVVIEVYQGEREIARDNRLLGAFRFSGLEREKRGIPEIQITFSIDINGILQVEAQDKKTGRIHTTTITKSSQLSDADLKKMIQEAEKNRELDKKRREKIEIEEEVESNIYTIDRFVKENEEFIKGTMRERRFDELKTKLKELLNGQQYNEVLKMSVEVRNYVNQIADEIEGQKDIRGDLNRK